LHTLEALTKPGRFLWVNQREEDPKKLITKSQISGFGDQTVARRHCFPPHNDILHPNINVQPSGIPFHTAQLLAQIFSDHLAISHGA